MKLKLALLQKSEYKDLTRYIYGLNKEKTAYIIFDRIENLVIYACKVTDNNESTLNKVKDYVKDNFANSKVTYLQQTDVSYVINYHINKVSADKKYSYTYKDLVQNLIKCLEIYKLAFLKPKFRIIHKGVYEITFESTNEDITADGNVIIANLNNRIYDFYYNGKKLSSKSILEDVIKPYNYDKNK